MDRLLRDLETDERRRRRRLLFRHNEIPLRLLVPNMVTLLSLCAGLTAIQMAVTQRYELAIALVVVAALLDGLDGRLARALKAQSKFGAELDSLADFVNFGVAPALLVFVWGLVALPRGLGWIVALVFALATGLRLARFNSMLDVEKPKWQSDYFTGMPAPFGAVTVLLPLYLDGLGLFDVRFWPWLVALYTIAMAALLISTIPIFSGKLLSERIPREYVLPLFVVVAALAALLLTYPYATLTVVTLLYLCAVPLSYRRFQWKLREPSQQTAAAPEPIRIPGTDGPAQEIRIGRSTPPAAADGH
jgi:CDP-diacylglycerol--serine O-phosphatidyltransferase